MSSEATPLFGLVEFRRFSAPCQSNGKAHVVRSFRILESSWICCSRNFAATMDWAGNDSAFRWVTRGESISIRIRQWALARSHLPGARINSVDCHTGCRDRYAYRLDGFRRSYPLAKRLVRPGPRQRNGPGPGGIPLGWLERLRNPQMGAVGLCGDTLCIQRGRDVTAIDPISGNTMWVRHNVEPSSDIFGDDEVVILAPASEKKALVLAPPTARKLASAQLPPSQQRWTTFGRNVLAWRKRPRQSTALPNRSH